MRAANIKLEIRESEAKSILHRINVPKLPFKWGANPYRGCEHDCWYCYARYTHEYLQLPMGMFRHVVFAKINAPEILSRELTRRSWKRELVNVGTVTDPYQPAERKYRLTRRMLQTFLACKTPVVITTKSHHVVDDLSLLNDFAASLFLNVVFTVTTMDENLKRKLEPSTCNLKVRFKAIEKLAAAGITVGVVMSPVFPYLTDSYERMTEIARAAAGAGVSYFLADTLNLRRSARTYLMPYLQDALPELAPIYEKLYRADYVPLEKSREVKRMQAEVASHYGLDQYELMRYEPPQAVLPAQLVLGLIDPD